MRGEGRQFIPHQPTCKDVPQKGDFLDAHLQEPQAETILQHGQQRPRRSRSGEKIPRPKTKARRSLSDQDNVGASAVIARDRTEWNNNPDHDVSLMMPQQTGYDATKALTFDALTNSATIVLSTSTKLPVPTAPKPSKARS